MILDPTSAPRGLQRFATLVLAAFLFTTVAAPAQAALIGTQQMIDARQGSTAARDRVQTFLARAEVRQQFAAMGVTPAQAEQRVAALSDAEVAQLSQRIEQLPAGAGVIELVGVVFIVLLILELVGVINIFNKF